VIRSGLAELIRLESTRFFSNARWRNQVEYEAGSLPLSANFGIRGERSTAHRAALR
jgi:hypothetical protein